MNFIDTLASLPLTRAIGWTVLHFLWQGTLIAAGAGLTLGLLRSKSAQVRYGVCCIGLALMLITPMATLALILAAGGTPDVLDLSAAFAGAAAPFARSERLNLLLPWVTLVWLTGFSLLQCRTLLHWTAAQRLKRTHTRPLPAAWQHAVSHLCERLGVRQAVRVVESTVADVPMLIGWLSPVILVPTGALCGLTPGQLRAVLAHELAHVRRHDSAVNLIQAAMESLLFFHPAVWWISDRLRVEREYCCDDVAVEVCGDTLCYARALSTLENMRGAPLPAVAANGGSLMNRIFRLVGARPDGQTGRGPGLSPLFLATSLVVLLAVVGIVLSGSPDARAASEPAPEPAAGTSEPAAHEPEPSKDAEPADEARLRDEIAGREQRQRAEARRAERRAMEQEREVLAELDRQLALKERQAGAAERAARKQYERAVELAERGTAEQERRTLAELDRRLALEGQQAAAAERAVRMEYQRALELAEHGEARQEREMLEELDRRLAREEPRAAAAERAARMQYQRARELADREAALKEYDDLEALSTRDLERELADREAALRELNREMAKLRDLILLKKTGKAARKQLKRKAAKEKSRLKELEKDLKMDLKKDAKQDKKREEIY